MAINILDGKLTGFITEVPAIVIKQRRDFRSIYETHRHRVYSLAFYATDNEMTAEEICGRVFCRAFATKREATAETIDAELVTVLRETNPIGNLTLDNQQVCEERSTVRENVKRVAVGTGSGQPAAHGEIGFPAARCGRLLARAHGSNARYQRGRIGVRITSSADRDPASDFENESLVFSSSLLNCPSSRGAFFSSPYGWVKS